MEANEYQKKAAEFARHDTQDYPLLALAEEVGEVMGKVAKYSRKYGFTADETVNHARLAGDGTILSDHCVKLHTDLLKELGDVQWQLARCETMIGVTLEEVMQANIEKLTDRKARNQIVGDGDNR